VDRQADREHYPIALAQDLPAHSMPEVLHQDSAIRRDVPTSWSAPCALTAATSSVERRLCDPTCSLAIRGLACGEQDGLRLVGQAVLLGWLEAGVVEQAEVGIQRIDPAAGCA
jgi:hypothetical protein